MIWALLCLLVAGHCFFGGLAFHGLFEEMWGKRDWSLRNWRTLAFAVSLAAGCFMLAVQVSLHLLREVVP